MSSIVCTEWRLRWHTAWVGLLLLGSAPGSLAAAPATQTLETPTAVGSALGAATSEVMLVTPALRSKAVAEALRRVATERGVKVYLLTDVRFVNEGSSYFSGLSMMKGVQVRLLRGLVESRATIDRRVTVAGPLLADSGSLGPPQPTVMQSEIRQTTRSAAWFSAAWASAKPYRYTLPPAPRLPQK